MLAIVRKFVRDCEDEPRSLRWGLGELARLGPASACSGPAWRRSPTRRGARPCFRLPIRAVAEIILRDGRRLADRVTGDPAGPGAGADGIPGSSRVGL
jgi:hypothetical protein